MVKPLLQCEKVSVSFGGVRALREVDISVSEGSITAIIGPNGAGKTTFLNAVSGLVPAERGSFLFEGRDISRLPAHERGRMGIVRTFQNLEIFSNMTVIENVMTGVHRNVGYGVFTSLLRTPRFWQEEERCRRRAEEELEFVGLLEKADMMADELPFGNQRLLEIARALASDPKLLLLDEPAAGMNIRETRDLGKLIKRINEERGVTIILVEHDMDLVMKVSHWIWVLNFGEVIASGTPLEVQKNPDVIAAYLGTEDEEGGDAEG
ncbi:MAG: ABC transporter ATP-binding protein [Deltaproteobacteria bacterium]|nr:MAG: ABC transporter ATP-binding protein [Deltaproteobacteria bacterium]